MVEERFVFKVGIRFCFMLSALCFLGACVASYNFYFVYDKRSIAVAWQTIGALAAAGLTGTAAFATLGTLLHLIQERKEVEVVRTFELYRKHKDEFSLFLIGIERQFEDKIRFCNSDYLYQMIFKDNFIDNMKLRMTKEEFRRTSFHAHIGWPVENIIEGVKNYEESVRQNQYVGDTKGGVFVGNIVKRLGDILNNLEMHVTGSPRDDKHGFYSPEGSLITSIKCINKSYLALECLLSRIEKFSVGGEQKSLMWRSEFCNPCLIHQMFLENIDNSSEKNLWGIEKDAIIALRKNAIAYSLAANLSKVRRIKDYSLESALSQLRCSGYEGNYELTAASLTKQFEEFLKWIPQKELDSEIDFRKQFDKRLKELLEAT